MTVPAPTGESPLKTPALRQFQIRGHRTGRPALRLIRHGGFSLVEASLRAHAPGLLRCAKRQRELPDASEPRRGPGWL